MRKPFIPSQQSIDNNGIINQSTNLNLSISIAKLPDFVHAAWSTL